MSDLVRFYVLQQRNAKQGAKLGIIGLKSDRHSVREVSLDEAHDLATHWSAFYIEFSAKNGDINTQETILRWSSDYDAG